MAIAQAIVRCAGGKEYMLQRVGSQKRGKEEKGGKLLCKYVKNSALFINKFLGLVIGNKCDK